MVPDWFLDALNRKCGDRPRREIVDAINAAVRRDPPWSLSAVYDFLGGKVTTRPMLLAFLVLFPDLPPPIFYASSEDEARRFQQLSQLFSAPPSTYDTPRVAETIEDTGEKPRTQTGDKARTQTGEKTRTQTGEKRPTAERTNKRAK
jgi:hypothetical protein